MLASPWQLIIRGIYMLLITAVISLTAQGTSNFFNPDASPSLTQSDLAVLKAGIIMLLVFNIFFLGILGVFHYSSSRSGAFADSANGNRSIEILVFTLYVAGTLVFARTIFRTVQIFSLSHSPAWRTQAFFWVFDASPLLISTALLNALHPGKSALRVENRC
jgi:heme/copper-type cytochrome/quinol oxidase subunit 2